MTTATETAVSYHDPLAWLPRNPMQLFPRKRVICDSRQFAESLFVVVAGRVKVTQTGIDGAQTVVRIVPPDGLFGELALGGSGAASQSAVALDTVKIRSWSMAEIERQIAREPALGVALVQYMVRQCLALADRIQCMALYKTPERVALSLVQLAEGLGQREEDGALRMGALTHQTIADYVGTSREIVTFQLNRLRRLGLVKYSRRHIDVYKEPIRDLIARNGVIDGPVGQ